MLPLSRSELALRHVLSSSTDAPNPNAWYNRFVKCRGEDNDLFTYSLTEVAVCTMLFIISSDGLFTALNCSFLFRALSR